VTVERTKFFSNENRHLFLRQLQLLNCLADAVLLKITIIFIINNYITESKFERIFYCVMNLRNKNNSP